MNLKMRSGRNWGQLAMKSKWRIKRISDIADINPRESISKGTIAKKVPMDSLMPFTRDVSSYHLEEFSGGMKFKNKDTIMARITPCLENGKTAQINCLGDNEVGFGSTEYIVFRAKEGIDSDYLYYLICSPFVRNPAIKSMVGSSGRQRVQKDVVANLQIAIPDFNSQVKIGGLLSNIDDKIKLNNEINKNLQEQAQSLYENLIADDQASTLVSLADLMDYAGGSQPPASEFIFEEREGYVRFVQIRDYDNDSHITYIPVSSRNKLCEEHDIMIARYGASLGRICAGINGAYNVALAKVFPKQPHYREFLRCYLSSRIFYEGINNRGGRSAQAGFNKSDINSFLLALPSDEKLHRFESITSALFEQRLNLQHENQKLSELRDTLLPKLMTGEIDTSAIDL